MQKIALGIEYIGTNFHGWQKQKKDTRTVQLLIEQALSKIANHNIKVYCAGRTDAGVHAKEQVVHFQTSSIRPDSAWLIGANRYLAEDISIKWVQYVNDNFHARFSAIARRYKYYIYNNRIRSALNNYNSVWIARKLSLINMQQASKYLVGEYNFSAFRGSQCQAKSTTKTIEYLKVNKLDNIITIDIKANAFLHHMVRNIVGTLLKIGLKEQNPNWMQEVLLSCDRTKAGVTMPAKGLHFIKAYYPENEIIAQ